METINNIFSLVYQVHWSLVIGFCTLLLSVFLLKDDDYGAASIEGSLYIGFMSVLSFGFYFTSNISSPASSKYLGIVCLMLFYCAVGFLFARIFVLDQVTKEKQRFKESLPAMKEYCVKKLHSNVDAVGDRTLNLVNICFDKLSGNITSLEYRTKITPLTKIPFKVGISQDLTDTIRQDLILKWVTDHCMDFIKSNAKVNYLHSYSAQALSLPDSDYFGWIVKEINTNNVFSLTRACVLVWPVVFMAELLKWAPGAYQNFKKIVVDNVVSTSASE